MFPLPHPNRAETVLDLTSFNSIIYVKIIEELWTITAQYQPGRIKEEINEATLVAGASMTFEGWLFDSAGSRFSSFNVTS
jgi:hypothetical protein